MFAPGTMNHVRGAGWAELLETSSRNVKIQIYTGSRHLIAAMSVFAHSTLSSPEYPCRLSVVTTPSFSGKESRCRWWGECSGMALLHEGIVIRPV